MEDEDWTDERVAKECLKRLREMGLTELRAMEAALPVSRGTLAKWQKGDYGMKPKTKRKLLAWLAGPLPAATPAPSYTEGLRFAVERVGEALGGVQATLSDLQRIIREREDEERAAALDRLVPPEDDARESGGR